MARRKGRGSRGKRMAEIDAQFYAQAAAENGGELPEDLKGPDGAPRRLGLGPEDAAYRARWCAIRDAGAGGSADVGAVCVPCRAAAGKSAPPDNAPRRSQEQREREPCGHGAVFVGCAHGRRIVWEDDPPQEGLKTGRHGRLEITAAPLNSSGADAIDVRSGLTAACSGHRAHVITVTPGPRYDGEPSDATAKFKACADPTYRYKSLLTGIFGGAAPNRYEVRVATCDGRTHIGNLDAYPDLRMKLKVEAELTAGRGSSSASGAPAEEDEADDDAAERPANIFRDVADLVEIARERPGISVDEEATFKLEGEYTKTYDGRTDSGKKAAPTEKGPLANVAKVASKLLGFLGNSIQSTVASRFEVESKTKIEAEWGYREDPAEPDVVFEIELSAVADPLLKLGFSVDLVDAVLAAIQLVPACSAAVKVIRTVRDRVGEGVGDESKGVGYFKAVATIELSVDGALALQGGSKWERRRGEWRRLSGTDEEARATLHGKLRGEASVVARGDLMFATFHFAAGATAEAETELVGVQKLALDPEKQRAGLQGSWTLSACVIKRVTAYDGSVQMGSLKKKGKGGKEYEPIELWAERKGDWQIPWFEGT